MKTAKRKTNKRKTSKRGGGWFWNDTTTPAASTEQKSSWGSWFSGMFGAKKPVDVPPTPANTPDATSASVPPTPANTPETTAPASNAQSTGGKRKTNKRKSKK